ARWLVTYHGPRMKDRASRQQMAEHPVAKLRLEPGAFGWHDSPGIRNRHQVLDAGGEHGKGAPVFAAVDQPLQFLRAANSADEVYAFAGARVVDAEDRVEDVPLQQCHVELFDWISCGGELWPEMQRVPVALQIQAQFVFAR